MYLNSFIFITTSFLLVPPIASNPLMGSVDLYKDTDPIVQLNVANFKSTIVATSNAWLIEFYSSWCGHCVSFAPDYIKLANDVKGWNKVIKLGAVDCAKDENIPLCRDYEIMGYPTLKFFPAFTEGSSLGVARKGEKTVDAIRRSMIDYIESQFTEKKAPPHWPILRTLQNETLDELWTHYNSDEIVLLFETPDDSQYWSREVIMDAHEFVPLYPPIRRVSANQKELINKYNVKSLPSFVFLERTGKSEVYSIQPNRDYIARALNRFFNSETPAAKPAVKVAEPLPANKAKKRITKDQIYMADLEGAIMYAFGHEVSIHKVIAGKELAALKLLVEVLDKYFPGRQAMMHAIKTLKMKLEQYKKAIKGEEFAVLWREALGGGESSREWVGCRGSNSNFRGYPCALWTTFHVLTVNYALKEPDEPALILKAMKGFIKYFFGCSHCSNHFVDMAEDETNPIETVRSPRQAVLWLWAAHNKVNRRLASDATEDPDAPKIQFPSTQNCPNCRVNGVESEEAIYDYLVKLYSPEHLSLAGIEDEREPISSGAARTAQLGTLSFTGYDISFFAAIYLVSSIILIVVLYRILVKKRYFRKRVCGKLI